MQLFEDEECAPPRRALLSRGPSSFVTRALDYAMVRTSPRAELEMFTQGSSLTGSKHHSCLLRKVRYSMFQAENKCLHR